MKILAYTEPDYRGELITIYEALRRRQSDPDNWEHRIYYDIFRSRPMIAVKRIVGEKDRSSFSYQGGSGASHGHGSKGIAHELAQDFLCRQTQFKFSLFNKSFVATVERVEDEVHIFDPNNSNRSAYVDVMLTLDKNCPLLEKFGALIAIEITDTHKNTQKKVKLFKDLGISALEVRIPAEWHIPNQTTVTTAELERLKKRIAAFWRSEVYVQYIHALGRIT